MSGANILYECTAVSRRFAEAQTIAELNQEWEKTRASFEAGWERHGHRLLTIVHDEKGYIGDDDVTKALMAINSFGKRDPIDVILHTHGGSAEATMQIAEVLVKRPHTATFVPIFAHSGGTMIALSTQKIYLGKGAALGPLDVQLGGTPARDIVQIVRELGEHASPILRAEARHAERVLKDWAGKVCKAINPKHKGFMSRRGCKLATALTDGEMYHSQSINFSMAKKLHMRVSANMPKSVYALLNVRLDLLRRLRELQEQILIEKPAPPSPATSG